MKKLCAFFVSMLLLGPISASADPILHYFEGSFNQGTGLPCDFVVCDGIFEYGSDFHGYFSLDSSAPDLLPADPYKGRYLSEGFPFGFAMFIEVSDTWIITTGVRSWFNDGNDISPAGTQDSVAIWSSGASLTEGVRDDFAISLIFCYPEDVDVLQNADQQAVPGLGVGCSSTAQVVGRFEGTEAYLGNLTEIRRVAEPGTLALFGIGLFGMGLARRCKKV